MRHTKLAATLLEQSNATDGVRLLDINGLARILGIARATIYSDLSRAPWKLPPAFRLPGRRKRLWAADEVVEWVHRYRDRTTEPCGVGLPRKPHSLAQAPNGYRRLRHNPTVRLRHDGGGTP